MSEDAEAAESAVVPGDKLVPRLAIGCLAFVIVMGAGTYLGARWLEPYFQHRNEAQQEKETALEKAHNGSDGAAGSSPPTAQTR